ncbi:uncharacterized protein [Macaca fascicularis]|uniref:uncharacterized protein n=1 Tax=Macaca fascicularis TaxID=9541 RepID=UPI0032B08013
MVLGPGGTTDRSGGASGGGGGSSSSRSSNTKRKAYPNHRARSLPLLGNHQAPPPHRPFHWWVPETGEGGGIAGGAWWPTPGSDWSVAASILGEKGEVRRALGPREQPEGGPATAGLGAGKRGRGGAGRRSRRCGEESGGRRRRARVEAALREVALRGGRLARRVTAWRCGEGTRAARTQDAAGRVYRWERPRPHRFAGAVVSDCWMSCTEAWRLQIPDIPCLRVPYSSTVQ